MGPRKFLDLHNTTFKSKSAIVKKSLSTPKSSATKSSRGSGVSKKRMRSMHTILLALLVLALRAYQAAANHNVPRRLRTGQKIRHIEGNLLHDYRFQPKFRINGRSYFVKNSPANLFLGEESKPQQIQQAKRKNKIRRSTSRPSIRKFKQTKLKREWRNMFNVARKKFIKRSGKAKVNSEFV